MVGYKIMLTCTLLFLASMSVIETCDAVIRPIWLASIVLLGVFVGIAGLFVGAIMTIWGL